MTICNNSKMTTLYYSDDAASQNFPCIVKMTDDEIPVEYDDDGLVQYCGVNDVSGHFVLTAREVDGRASLHRFPESEILEGSWVEGAVLGMWRVHLA